MAFEKGPTEKPEEEFKKEGSVWVPKEERGHIRSAEEVEMAREDIVEEKKIESTEEREERKEKEWKYGTRALERIKDAEREWSREKKAMELAEVPEEGMEAEETLKEVGVEKPAESFEEAEERLKEELKTARSKGGEKLSKTEEIDRTRDFYLKELDYSLEYQGLLRGKARVLDSEGKYVADEKGEPREFKAFFKLKEGNTPLIDFLKEELRGKFEKKTDGATEKTEEEKLEAGFQGVVRETENKQKLRGERISSLKDVKEVGKERLSKLAEGLSYIAALDKLGILGIKKSKDIAIEGGKDLANIGLTPAAAVEEAGRYIAGVIQTGEALRKSSILREKEKLLEKVPVGERPEYFNNLLEVVRLKTGRLSEELMKGYDKIYKKGKILKLIEALGGKLSGPIGKTFGPASPSSPNSERI